MPPRSFLLFWLPLLFSEESAKPLPFPWSGWDDRGTRECSGTASPSPSWKSHQKPLPPAGEGGCIDLLFQNPPCNRLRSIPYVKGQGRGVSCLRVFIRPWTNSIPRQVLPRRRSCLRVSHVHVSPGWSYMLLHIFKASDIDTQESCPPCLWKGNHYETTTAESVTPLSGNHQFLKKLHPKARLHCLCMTRVCGPPSVGSAITMCSLLLQAALAEDDLTVASEIFKKF